MLCKIWVCQITASVIDAFINGNLIRYYIYLYRSWWCVAVVTKCDLLCIVWHVVFHITYKHTLCKQVVCISVYKLTYYAGKWIFCMRIFTYPCVVKVQQIKQDQSVYDMSLLYGLFISILTKLPVS